MARVPRVYLVTRLVKDGPRSALLFFTGWGRAIGSPRWSANRELAIEYQYEQMARNVAEEVGAIVLTAQAWSRRRYAGRR